MMETDLHPYPRLRWLAVLWLLMYVPSYAIAYGWLNFLFLCNLGVILTAVALIAGHQLLLSSQAVAAPMIGLVWATDAGARLITGSHLFGGTAYMWDPQYPVFTRVLSLYHILWPILVLWCVKTRGYDRRGWPLQTAIAAAGIVIARLITEPELNVNYAFTDPFWGRQLGPAALHLLLTVSAMGLVLYALTHLLLTRVLRCPHPESAKDPS